MIIPHSPFAIPNFLLALGSLAFLFQAEQPA